MLKIPDAKFNFSHRVKQKKERELRNKYGCSIYPFNH